MAPSKFQIYVDQSMRQPPAGSAQQPPTIQHVLQPPQTTAPGPIATATLTKFEMATTCVTAQTHVAPVATVVTGTIAPKRYIAENLESKNMRFSFDERKLYPVNGDEYSFEELNYIYWRKRESELTFKRRFDELLRENEELKQEIERLHTQLRCVPASRLSIVPQSLQAESDDVEMSCSVAYHDPPSVVPDYWKQTCQFTVPIDQSQYIRENAATSTPTNKNDCENRRGRRMSRPSMGGSPTMKLSPITETSRDCNSKSSSSSSAMSSTGGTLKKPLVMEPIMIDEPDRPLDPNDPTTYRQLLRALTEPIDRRTGYTRVNKKLPKISNGLCFGVGADSYLVDKELPKESRMFTAQLLSDDDSDADIPAKTICFRVDQPPNEWLYYICNELHRRMVRQKIQPDIELSVMSAEPAFMYTDGSILVDEYFRFVPLNDYFSACNEMKKPFPKSFAAYITLELIHIVRGLQSCDILHMDLRPHNIVVTGCPSRDDIASVDERSSIIKLIGFDHAMDTRLLQDGFKFKDRLEHLETCEMQDSKPWTHEVDWYGVLNCIHLMFFLEPMKPVKEGGRWQVQKEFKGQYPTNVWSLLFDELLNIQDLKTSMSVVNSAASELSSWVKANISFVLKEAANLDIVLEDFCKASNKSVMI